ncbi:MAG: hypothetical protein JSV42_19615 [Chloroflexota bacterium]|nr:MAG: hypothetical protein JSV42_19615 [Chloroflexota bacterium]
MEDPPKQVFSILSITFAILFFVSLAFEAQLPERIFGQDTDFWRFFLLIAAVGIHMGWKIVAWFRRRG